MKKSEGEERRDQAGGFYLQQSFSGKTKIFVVADNQVIEELDIEYLGGISDFFGKLDICLAGFQVAGGVVVAYNKAAGQRRQSFLENQFAIHDGTGNSARANAVFSNGGMCPVEEDDPKFFVG